ncbi:WxL domain-containing protein [Pullulanibacillus sp. KACC 23026]|uniref:WxL domain-containing protein n=1 Tax=Pullulanibacillus sp. KACC 23026 TaxID=3028315 RepID=UPI0023AF151D|nr:WxL domain-containing protein [Pullulanibacillus sp. KACC 23026]WEG13232.1 WxL domain-containing protein [Pullulanibacillus sp. KACC 23026]
MKISSRKFLSTVSALALVCTVFIGSKSAFAASTTITGGDLGVTTDPTVGDFSSVTLDGSVQTTTASMGSLTVTDARGTGAGWNVVVSATPFKTSDSSHTLPTDSLSLASPTEVTPGTGSSDASTVTKKNGTIDNSAGLKLLSAAVDGGMGTYTVSFPDNALTLTLNPKDVYAGTYTSTVAVTVTTGP